MVLLSAKYQYRQIRTLSHCTNSSYVDRAATGAGVISDLAAGRKLDKYSSLSSSYTIQPIAVDNLGGFSTSTTSFLSELGRRLSSVHMIPTRPCTCSSGFQWRFNALILCFCTTLFQATHQTNSHSQLF